MSTRVKSVRTLSPQEGKTSMLQFFTARVLAFGLAALVMAFGTLSSVRPSADPMVEQPSVMLAASADDPPTGDCIEMASLILTGVAIRAGAAAYAVGAGAAYENAGAALSHIMSINSTFTCVTYLVPRYIDQVCEQSRQGLRYRKTWEARALVSLATAGKKNRC